jgi:hypothetical protein
MMNYAKYQAIIAGALARHSDEGLTEAHIFDFLFDQSTDPQHLDWLTRTDVAKIVGWISDLWMLGAEEHTLTRQKDERSKRVRIDQVIAALTALARDKGLVGAGGGVEIYVEKDGVRASLAEAHHLSAYNVVGETEEEAVTRLWRLVEAAP